MINIGEKSSFADFFVNATAGSDRQLAALGDYAEDVALELGLEIRSATGRTGAGWVLVDCGDIIVNIFTETMREKYALDKLWSDCETTHIA